MLDLGSAISGFFSTLGQGRIEVYNEFSLQHELGVWLRHSMPSSHRVQFERPSQHFGIPGKLEKKEIDIVIMGAAVGDSHAIELKFPQNGQYPEQMFSACRDIAFLEQLCANGFAAGWFVMLASDPLFHSRGGTDGIYSYFRGAQPLRGVINKPTGDTNQAVVIHGAYQLDWRATGISRFLSVEVRRSRPEAL